MSSKKKTEKEFNRFSEKELLKVSSEVCNVSPQNIILIGGGTILSELIEYRRLRERSDDLDFIANDTGFGDASNFYDLRPASSMIPQATSECYATFVDGIFVGIFYNQIKGYDIPPGIYRKSLVKETSQGIVYVTPPEFNIALKIRRGASKGKIYGKDGLDFASICISMSRQNQEFDVDTFSNYMQSGVCESCRLPVGKGCIDYLETGVTNLPKNLRNIYLETTERCKTSIRNLCRHNNY